MGKFNFKNYDRKNRNYGNNDLNIDRLSRELIDTPRRSTNYGHRGMQNQAPRVGVNLQLMSGQFLKTAEFTVDDIAEALDHGKRWLKQKKWWSNQSKICCQLQSIQVLSKRRL